MSKKLSKVKLEIHGENELRIFNNVVKTNRVAEGIIIEYLDGEQTHRTFIPNHNIITATKVLENE